MRATLLLLLSSCGPFEPAARLTLYGSPEAISVSANAPVATARVTNLGTTSLTLDSLSVEGSAQPLLDAVIDGVLPLRMEPGDVVTLEVALDFDGLGEDVGSTSAVVTLAASTTEPAPGPGDDRVTLTGAAQVRVLVGAVTCDVDGDGEDRASCGGADCDDLDASVFPGAEERCDGSDDDCDGAIDEGALDAVRVAPDGDDDGHGDPDGAITACDVPDGYVTCGDCNDCDDTDPNTNPGAPEVCGGGDEDCDEEVDEDGAQGEVLRYEDRDGDGYGDAAVLTCAPGPDEVALGGDCDDADDEVNPGATERCDGADDDCSGRADDGDVCPCPVAWFGETPFMFCEATPLDWDAAARACASVSYTLATVRDAAEDAWLASQLFERGDWWAGGTDDDREGTWTWVSGAAWSYENWGVGQPSGGGQDCLELGRLVTGEWNDGTCSLPHAYVCSAIDG